MEDIITLYFEPLLNLWVVKVGCMTSYSTAVLFEERPGLNLKFIHQEATPDHPEVYKVRYDTYLSQHPGWDHVHSLAFKYTGAVVFK